LWRLFVKKFVKLMPQQFLALWTMLNFNENNNLKRRMHLEAFYLRMVLYQFIAMNRIRNSQTFCWWALCNAAARYGSHDVQAWSNLSVHYMVSRLWSVHSTTSFCHSMTTASWWRLVNRGFLCLVTLVFWFGTIHSQSLHWSFNVADILLFLVKLRRGY
jgi:hypothetical protein